MSKKDIGFSIFQLIVNGETFSFSDFISINTDFLEQQKIGEEIVGVKKIEKTSYEDRFISFYFESGDRFPYSEKVINIDTNEEIENPRDSTLIELDNQIFVLLDQKYQRFYISNQKQKNYVSDWFKDKLNKEIIIKALIDKTDFFDKINKISEISFSAEPNILINSTALGQHLVQDIFGYEATEVRVNLSYGDGKDFLDGLRKKVESLFTHKEGFKKITIVGKTDDKMSSILNMEEVINKIYISQEVDKTTKKFNQNMVFSNLISKIKENE